MDDTLVTVGTLLVGGVGTVATAVSGYLIGKRRAVNTQKRLAIEEHKVEVEADKVEVEADKVEIQQQRIELQHHETIVGGYKDLLTQYQNARDIARKEVHDLRDVVGALSNKVELLTKNHAKCEGENAELKATLAAAMEEMRAMREEMAELRSAYPPQTSSAPEAPTAA